MNRVSTQRGATMVVVMILLIVMLLGAVALARVIEASTQSAGNEAFRDTSLQASEVGVNTAFNALLAIPVADEGTNQGVWYSAMNLATDSNGLPVVTWDSLPELTVGAHSVRYVVERVCTVSAVTNPLRECLIKQVKTLGSARDDDDKLDPPNSRQYRITVRVVGPKGSTTFVQSLVTKG